MTSEHAADICTWRYASPYQRYDMTSVDPNYLLDPANQFFVLLDAARLIGFRSFGADGQVAGGTYDSSALDTGGGLRPELVGLGLGRRAIGNGLDFGARTFDPPAFRVTIASSNGRALEVVAGLGFREIDVIGADEYRILVLRLRDR